jgi:4-hydroxy-tetrahydrodipicolinate synthase
MTHDLQQLRGSVVALATPFRGARLDEPALARMVERQIAAGSAAIVTCGSTGEAASLTPAEAARTTSVVVEAAARRVPVLAGCSSMGTQAACQLAVAAARAGADALLVAAPAYVKPTQEGIAAHVRSVAHGANRPVMLYDVPGRTGVKIANVTVALLAEAGLIFAIRDASADLGRPPRLRALCGPQLLQLSGDDASAVAHLAMGGSGCVSVAANVAPSLCAAIHRAWEDGDLPGLARAMEATRQRLEACLDAIMQAEQIAAPRPRLMAAQ